MNRILLPAILLAISLTGCDTGGSLSMSTADLKRSELSGENLLSSEENEISKSQVCEAKSQDEEKKEAEKLNSGSTGFSSGNSEAATSKTNDENERKSEAQETAAEETEIETQPSAEEPAAADTKEVIPTESTIQKTEIDEQVETDSVVQSPEASSEVSRTLPTSQNQNTTQDAMTEKHTEEITITTEAATVETTASETGSTEETTTPKISPVNTDAYASEVIRLINAERVSRGLSELQVDPELMAYAKIRAEECSVLFSHERPDGSPLRGSTEGSRLWIFAENCHSGGDPNACFTGWMNSEMHRTNLYSGATHIGVGCFQASDGCTYYTAQFGMAGVY